MLLRLVPGLFVWLALAVQLWVMLESTGAQGIPLNVALIRFFSFFTILTNTSIALTLTLPVIAPASALGRWFASPRVRTGIAAAITLVGIVYSVLLRGLIPLGRVGQAVDFVLHDLMPIAFLLFWWWTVPKRTLQWSDLARWAIYPLAYLGYVLLFGMATSWYPYPFLNVNERGGAAVAIASVGVAGAFVAIGALLLVVSRFSPTETRPS